jgi:uncharacterized RDD family membrane protein YckC
MDKNPSEGNELWRLLQGDSDLPAADTGEAAAEDPAEASAPASSSKLPPGRRPPIKSFPDPVWRDQPEDLDASPVNPGSDQYMAQDSSGPVGPVSTDTSQLQKILSQAVDDDFEYKPQTADQHGDVDIAVKAFNRMQEELIFCKHHRETEATAQCPSCQAFYCQACLIVRRGKLICRDCAEAEFAPTEEEVLAALEMGMDAPPADTQIGEQERPEFEIGGSFLGGEGRPTNTFGQLLAWMLDFVLVRGLILLAVWLLGSMLADNPHPLLHLLDAESSEARRAAVVNTLLLMGLPNGKWLAVLPLLVVIDMIYQFTCLLFFNRTVGMSWVGIRVVTEWGEYVGAGSALARSAVSALLLGGPATLIGAVFPDFRGPQDMAAGTMVINYSGLKRVDAYETIPIKRA